MLSITALLKASAHAPSLNTWLPQTHEAAEVLSGKTVLKHRYPPPDYCPSLQLPSIPTVHQQFCLDRYYSGQVLDLHPHLHPHGV